MGKLLEKKPDLIYNAIPEQVKQVANTLSIAEWNQVVNVLKRQSNLTTAHVEKLHRVLFGDWELNSNGYVDYIATLDEGLLEKLMRAVEEIKSAATIHVGSDQPIGENVVFWIDTEN